MRDLDPGGRKPQLGVSLIELMVAMLIGLFLVAGAVTIYSQSRTTFRTTEAIARLQETARFAFDVLEPEIRMANYWGFNSRATYIGNRASATQGVPSYFSTREADIDICGNNWAINLEEYIGGSNNGYFSSATGCLAFNNSPRTGSDTLIIRRAAELPSETLTTNRIFIQTSRIQGTLFVPTSTCLNANSPSCIPEGYSPPQSRSHALMATGYYVANDSTGRQGFPSLRRKRMVAGTGSQIAQVQDEEVVPGIEDMQVRFGIDTNGDTNVDQYVNPGAVPGTASVVSATIWLRVRSEEPEVGQVDSKAYQYADGTAVTPNDGFRRIVVSKTIQLRNTRT